MKSYCPKQFPKAKNNSNPGTNVGHREYKLTLRDKVAEICPTHAPTVEPLW